MGFFNALFGTTSKETTPKTYQYVVDNANAFAGLCRKIAKGGDKSISYPIYYELQTTSTGLIKVYATHTVHDDDWLEYAHNRAMENDRFGVEYAYNHMIENYKLTRTELKSFQDVSDFMDFLRGGIPGYNSCKHSGNDMEITQELGHVQSYDKNKILSEIEKSILNSYTDVRSKGCGTTSLAIKI